MNQLYIVFSSTPYKMGRLVRHVTGDVYNHVSISLDRDLRQMYSFARRYYKTPFYGGFVRESVSRYIREGKTTQVCICSIPVTDEQFENLAAQLLDMEENKEHYLYNHLSAVASVFGRTAKREDSYTCVEFCTDVLREVGIALDLDRYYTIGQLHSILEPNTVYTGPLSPSGEPDAEFYAKAPLDHPSTTTLHSIGKLLKRKRYPDAHR